MYETVLEPGELIAEVRVPAMPAHSKAAYLRYSALSANDWPCLSVAALVREENGRSQELRLALGGVAATPVLVNGLDFVRDQSLDAGVLEKLLKVVDEQIAPFSDLRGSEWYKRQMVRVFVKKAIAQLSSSGN
jgi:carbon-monoxide dehydrogenase medium subunit